MSEGEMSRRSFMAGTLAATVAAGLSASKSMAAVDKKKTALVVWGGWMGHEPDKCAAIFAPWLKEQGFEEIGRAHV